MTRAGASRLVTSVCEKSTSPVLGLAMTVLDTLLVVRVTLAAVAVGGVAFQMTTATRLGLRLARG